MGDQEKLERFERKRAKLVTGEVNGVKDTRKNRKIAEGIADILEKRRLEAVSGAKVADKVLEKSRHKATSRISHPVDYGGIEIFDEPVAETARKIIAEEGTAAISLESPPEAPRVPEAVLPKEIDVIEDQRLWDFHAKFNDQLLDHTLKKVDPSLIVDVFSKPLSKNFHQTLKDYINLHERLNGKEETNFHSLGI